MVLALILRSRGHELVSFENSWIQGVDLRVLGSHENDWLIKRIKIISLDSELSRSYFNSIFKFDKWIGNIIMLLFHLSSCRT